MLIFASSSSSNLTGPDGILLATWKSRSSYPWDVCAILGRLEPPKLDEPVFCPALLLHPRPQPAIPFDTVKAMLEQFLAWLDTPEAARGPRPPAWKPEQTGWEPRYRRWSSLQDVWTWTNENLEFALDLLGDLGDHQPMAQGGSGHDESARAQQEKKTRQALSTIWIDCPWSFLLDEHLRLEAFRVLEIPHHYSPEEKWKTLLFAASLHGEHGGPWPPSAVRPRRERWGYPVQQRAAYRDLMDEYAKNRKVTSDIIIAFLLGLKDPKRLWKRHLRLKNQALAWEQSLDDVTPYLVPFFDERFILGDGMTMEKLGPFFEDLVMKNWFKWLHTAFMGQLDRLFNFFDSHPREPLTELCSPGPKQAWLEPLRAKRAAQLPGITKRLVWEG